MLALRHGGIVAAAFRGKLMHKFKSSSRVLAAAVSSVFVVAATSASALTITLNGTAVTSCGAANVDPAGNITLNCSTTNTPACSVSAAPTSLPSSGGTVTLTSNCGTVTSWTGGKSASGGQNQSWTDAIPANTSTSSQTFRYSVVGANGTNFVDVTQQGTGSAPPPTGDLNCSNIAGVSKTTTINVPWQYVSGLVSTRTYGGFGAGQAVVFAFTPPAGASSGGAYGNFRFSPSGQDAYNNRMASISDTPCDFSGKLGGNSIKRGQEAVLYYSVGGYPKTRYGTTNATNPDLIPGKTYYVTVIQQDTVGGTNTCNSAVCNVDFALTKAPGT
jgi:hypothetical protein